VLPTKRDVGCPPHFPALRAADRWCEAQLTGWEVELFEEDPVAESRRR
jgi:hypothetical protein